ncbi:mitochondrial glyco protein [Piedraia hortae CBS 480.64]|uniref:Mitochondrial glyco protein n=1 Tax=Piedraia hortae CBS 480.64 TaxID=1314780 RepID=A0A6A7C4G8_9PEZI|nr:mitochondrial glyco protein [Piedraia hortae CBS 480.64]
MLTRTVYRAIPRGTTRFACRTPFRRFPTQRVQAFSLSHSRFDSASQQLAAKLSQEAQLESNEMSKTNNLDVKSFLEKNPGWKISDTTGTGEVIMERKYEDEDITVMFNVSEADNSLGPDEEMEDEMSDDELDSDEINSGTSDKFKVVPEDRMDQRYEESDSKAETLEEEDWDVPIPAEVRVLIRKRNKGALKLYMDTTDSFFHINHVVHLPDSKEMHSTSAVELLRKDTDGVYTGPLFPHLDEEVQSLFHKYLEARGINTNLSMFIPDHVIEHEQKEYVDWLKRLQSFVE